MNQQQILKNVRAELENFGTYLFSQLKKNLVDAGISANHETMRDIDILTSETYGSCVEKGLKLTAKYTQKLKMLTILSCFFGCSVYNLNQLVKELKSTREECISLLLQASIFKLVSVKIDEANNQIHINNCKIRERQVSGDTSKYIAGKLIQITEKNSGIQREIKNIINSTQERKTSHEESRKDKKYF